MVFHPLTRRLSQVAGYEGFVVFYAYALYGRLDSSHCPLGGMPLPGTSIQDQECKLSHGKTAEVGGLTVLDSRSEAKDVFCARIFHVSRHEAR